MHQRIVGRSLLLLCLALPACGGGGGGAGEATPSRPAPPLISFSHIFPQGDATAANGVAWDVVGVKTTLSGEAGDNAGQLYDTLRVDVTFAQDISMALPAPGQPFEKSSQLGVPIQFDIDHNVSTGAFDTCDVSSGLTPFEFVADDGSDPSRLSDGNYSILSALGAVYSGSPNPPEEARVSVFEHVLSETVYLPAIHVDSGLNIPRIGINLAALNGADGQTDCVPKVNGEIYTDQQ